MASTFKEVQDIIGLAHAIDTGKLDDIYDAVAKSIDANAAKSIAEAKDLLGEEDFHLYVPMSRSALRARKELQRLEHQQRMFNLEYEDRKKELAEKAKVRAAGAKRAITAKRPSASQPPAKTNP